MSQICDNCPLRVNGGFEMSGVASLLVRHNYTSIKMRKFRLNGVFLELYLCRPNYQVEIQPL